MMEAPERLADRIAFMDEYIPSNQKQRVSRATGLVYGQGFFSGPPTVTEWTEREEDVPGHTEMFIYEMWYTEDGKTIGRKQPLWKLDKERQTAYLASLAAQNVVDPNASGLMQAWQMYKGWGEAGFAFEFQPKPRYRLTEPEPGVVDIEWI